LSIDRNKVIHKIAVFLVNINNLPNKGTVAELSEPITQTSLRKIRNVVQCSYKHCAAYGKTVSATS